MHRDGCKALPCRGLGRSWAFGGCALTETEMLVIIIDGLVVFVAASLFVRFLCDEYLRDLDLFGLIRRPPTTSSAEAEEPLRGTHS